MHTNKNQKSKKAKVFVSAVKICIPNYNQYFYDC